MSQRDTLNRKQQIRPIQNQRVVTSRKLLQKDTKNRQLPKSIQNPKVPQKHTLNQRVVINRKQLPKGALLLPTERVCLQWGGFDENYTENPDNSNYIT
jgi:hypothetical protein